MGRTLAHKIIESHLQSGLLYPGDEIGIKVDQTLTQDVTGMMTYLQFESMEIPRIKTEKSVAYVDHNSIQLGYENTAEQTFVRTAAAKYGAFYSCSGNGISHQVHCERFGKPGKVLIGADKYTPTAGGLGMLAFATDTTDVAIAMAGGEYSLKMPRMMKINLNGELGAGLSAKDVILEILRQIGVNGAEGSIIEYAGSGLDKITVPQRCTIASMGVELGAVSSIFPSDDQTKDYLILQNRQSDWTELKADNDAIYSQVLNIQLDKLVPLVACPSRPDNIKPAHELSKVKVDQVCIGSCSNSSLNDILIVAAMLKNKKIADDVNLLITPGSKQVLSMLIECGALTDLVDSGARILECGCGPCTGLAYDVGAGGVSVRTYNRNYDACPGLKNGDIYLSSPETAAATAITGFITDPTFGSAVLDDVVAMVYKIPQKYRINDNQIIAPFADEDVEKAEIIKSPNIKIFPVLDPIGDNFKARVLLKLGDDITTDHIITSEKDTLLYSGDIPHLTKYCFKTLDPTFAIRARKSRLGILVAGKNFGQGNVSEMSVLVPRLLGVKAIIAKSFSKKYFESMIKVGILPLVFENPEDYELIEQDVKFSLLGISESIETGKFDIQSAGKKIEFKVDLTPKQKEIIKVGGLLNFTMVNKK